jgi:carbonic anhydrase
MGMVCCLTVQTAAVEKRHDSNRSKKVQWTYKGKTGPEHWGHLSPDYALCRTGKSQSPIDITKTTSANLGAISFNYKKSPLKILNKGYTIEVNYTGGSAIIVAGKTFKLVQFHFHSPGENTRNGNAYDMEMHLVHEDNKDQLAVIGVFMRRGNQNPVIQTLWDNIPEEINRENTVGGISINALELLPENRSYFHFDGSLTTPPCHEEVKWYVLKTPVEVSDAQVKQFLSVIGPNARPVQPLNGRTIYEVNQ